MARTATKRKNFLGFGKKTTYSPKLVRRKVTKKNPSAAFWKLQKRAASAEKRFLSALKAAYGSRASEMRYRPSEQSAKIRALGAALRRASDAEISAAAANPAKFDKCVSKVSKSLKQAKRPGNAYAICTAAGTRTAKSSNAPRLEGRAKRKNAKKRRNYQYVIWSGKQGNAEAEVYKTKTGFEVQMSDGSVLRAQSRSDALSIARLKLYELARNPSTAISGQDLVPGSQYADTVAKIGTRVYKGVKKSATGLLKTVKAKIGGRKNPLDRAMTVYEDFHGLPSTEILEFTEEERYHSVKVGLGLLVSLEVLLANSDNKQVDLNAPGFTYRNSGGGSWDFDEATPLMKRVLVTSSEDGKQLFFDGGDQAIPDSALEAWGFSDRDKHDHMVIGEIKILTYRTQKSFDKGETVDYFHELGKEGSKGVLPLLLYYPRSKTMKVAGGRYYIAPPDRNIGASPGLVG